MKSFYIACLVFIASSTYAQDWSVGVRLGDPSGISLKKYLGGKKTYEGFNAVEVSFGRAYVLQGQGAYNRKFDSWHNANDEQCDERYLVSSESNTPLGLQVHYLVQENLSQIGTENIKGLDWYYGFGGQIRSQSILYTYRCKKDGSSILYTEKVSDIDLGADGVIGLEYAFDGAPISVYADLTLFMEIADDPFLFWFQSGIGVRYEL